MKNFMLKRLILLAAFFSILGAGNVWAQLTELEVGGVYHFTNVSYTAKAMVATTPSSIAGVTTDNTNKAQLWYVETSQVKEGVTYYALRNLGYGTYLQGNGKSSAWSLANTTDSDKSWFALTAANGKTAIRSYNERSNNHGFAHIDGSSNVVGWSTDAQATQWTVTKVAMSDSDIQAALGIFNNVATYQTALNDLFSDKACTELKVTFDENNASFKALPTTLQNMVRKVAGGDAAWTELNKDNTKDSWGADYAKKYRVQLYEPYNDAGAAASALGLNAHNSLNNPTGIFANNGDVLYVMVDGEIEEGASLYLAYYTGHGKLDASSKVGYELKQGLNVIPVYQNSSNFCVNYVVQTFDTSDGKKGNKAKARRLSEYAPIKIHIEGGYINGYYNKVGDALYPADKNANWDYIEARATQTDVTVLGKYVTLQFPLKDEDTYDGDNNKNKGLASIFNDLVEIEKSIDEWDNVMLWERLLLGVLGESTIQAEAKTSPYAIDNTKKVFEYTGRDGEFESDYSDYYNIHGLSLGTPTGYMYGGWDHCGYHYNTMQAILVNMTTESGPHWGPGHEIGHQHQNLLTVNGLTEVTNNLFSNVVLWYFGKSTSRYNGTDGSLSNVLQQFNADGTDFFSNNIWAQTIMYYKLFLYYHVLGHNPKFYPRLFEMLRQDPMSTGYNQDGSKCLMHFYKKCCLAAGEDLTEFFRAHGFFEVMDNRLVGDYSNSVYNLTQVQIDAAIKEVKDLGYKENISVLFITDATNDEIQSHKEGTLTPFGTVCGEYGSYSTFNDNTEASYTYNISGTTVTMEGTGGVGFAILNGKGELIGFSDKKTFELSPEAAEAIISGEASIVTLQADNTPVVATNIMDSGDDDTRHQLLGNLLDDAKVALDCSDDTGTKVGFYRASALEDLLKAYDTAKGVYDAKTVSAYSAVYDVLFQEYTNLINNAYARINITDGAAYRLTSKAYSNLNMGVATSGDDVNEMFGLTADGDPDAQIWYLEPGTTKGTYYLKNKATSLYPASASWGAVLKADKEESTKGEKGGAAPYTLHDMGNGAFALSNGYGLHCSKSQSNNIVGWSIDSEATQWYITAVEVDNALEARLKLEETIEKTAALVDEMADAVAIQKLTLQNDDPTTPFYISTNACYNTLTGKTDGQGLSGLLDDETSTYFHSDYDGKVSGTHYLQVDLGASHNVEQFKFNYATRDNGNNCPTAILVEGSADGTTFNQLATYTAANDELPNGKALSWESPVISNSENYRYLRFSVTATENSKAYFVMSTFGITNPTPLVTEIKDGFANFVTGGKEALKAQIVNALTKLAEAQQLVDGASATEDDYNQQNSDLTTHYNNLLTVYNTAKNADFNAKKAELGELISVVNALISECGTVNCTPATSNEAQLQTTKPDDNFYLWTNAQSTQEGPIADLIDGDNETHFHSDYSGNNSTDGFDHHLTVNLVGETASKFRFSYITRHDAETNYPKTIKVYGSTDGTIYEEVTTITGLTAQNTWTYNSEVIAASKEFKHLRFMVTATNNNNLKGGHPIFHMAEFDLTIEKSAIYTAELKNNVGEVTTDLLIATYKETAEAQSTYNLATTEQQVVKAIAQLQAQYDALLVAKANVYKQELRAKIAELDELIHQYGDVTYDVATDTYTATVDPNAGSVTEKLLIDAAKAKAAAEEVANTSTDQVALIAEKETLTTHCEALQAAFATKLYPVTITTDEEHPVLYTFKSRRGNAKAVQYLPEQNCKFKISNLNTKSGVQAFYFTEGTERGQVFVHPYVADGLVLAANNIDNGEDKVFATEKGTANYDEWKFVEATVSNDIWYSLQLVGTSTFFSNYGGGDKKMGFYSTADDGSYLQFVASTVEGSIAYNLFKSYYDNLPSGTIEGSDRLGCYPEAQADAYNQVYHQATMVLNYGGTPVEGSILTADDMVTSTTARVIGINSIYANNYNNWVNEQGYTANLGLDKVISLEPVTEGQAGTYYLKVVYAGEMGYFQTSGYTIGAKETAQVFVPIAASTSGTGNAKYNNVDWDNSGNSDASKLVRFVRGSATGTDWLNPGSKKYNDGLGPWTVFNVHTLEFTTSDEQYIATYNALRSAYEALEMNMPEDGGYYIIQSVSRGDGKLVYANPTDNKMYWGSSKTATSPEAIWKFEDNGDGTYIVSNMHTGTMMNGFISNDPSPLNPTSGSVTLKSLAADGQIGIYSNGAMMHAQGSDSGEIVHWETGANDASAWRIQEVDVANVVFTATIGSSGYAGLHLNYPVVIPVGFEAYYVDSTTESVAKLSRIEGVIPANEGVLLKGEVKASCPLKYSTNPGTDISESNILKGANYTSYLPGKDGWKYFLFGVKNSVAGFYWSYLNYNANGTIVDPTNDGYNDAGGHFRCTANKIYLPIENTNAASFTLRFNNPTVIEDLLNGLNNEEVIYDIQGRRITKVTESGIYIVNGQKRYIHVK